MSGAAPGIAPLGFVEGIECAGRLALAQAEDAELVPS